MSFLRFPFNWGAVPDVVIVPPPVVVPSSGTRWTALAATPRAWIEGITTPHRFERIYAQPVGRFGQSVNFAYRVQSQFPFIVKTGNQVFLSSAISTP